MPGRLPYTDLPFDEAIEFFRGKVNIPTRRWNDLWQGMHARGFMVAGAVQDTLLTDLRGAVNRAIAEGTTLADFRKSFDDTVARHGWAHTGNRNWRSRLIFSTNIRTAYSAGRWKQMTDPDALKYRPYLEYRHGDSIDPREIHLGWHGLVVAADDAWWRTHYPPNGWGCKCKAFAVGKRDLKRMGKTGPDTAPDNGTYEWTDKQGHTHTIPNGIDPGWDYNVGEASWGRTEALRLAEDQGPWEDLNPKGPEAFGRPAKLTNAVDTPRAKLGKPVKKGDEAGLRAKLRSAIGGDEVALTDPTGNPVMITQAIADHVIADPKRWDGREAYFPLIRELIEDPYEIWISFAQSEVSGRVGIRRKYVKAVRIGKNRVLGLWAETMNGHWVSQDFFRGGLTGAGRLRKGRLLYGRK